MQAALRSLNGATFRPTNWQHKDKELLDSPFCIGDSVRVSKHEYPKLVFIQRQRQSLFGGNNDVVFSLNGYHQETKASIEDPKLRTSSASLTIWPIIWENDDIFSLNGYHLKQNSPFLSFLGERKTKQCTFWANDVRCDPRILKRCHFPTYIAVGWKLGMFGFS